MDRGQERERQEQPTDQYLQRRRLDVTEAEDYVMEKLSEMIHGNRELNISDTIGLLIELNISQTIGLLIELNISETIGLLIELTVSKTLGLLIELTVSKTLLIELSTIPLLAM